MKKKTKKELFVDHLNEQIIKLIAEKNNAFFQGNLRDQEDAALQLSVYLNILDKVKEIL